ncbi:MAG: polymer-forming cytoskeletal protein [Planctomycetes bacterium]|nr:polymer-forming cytoskeletal protein [Planctomycetota bacterium]MBI3835371.1 polymer-forming cytoskeletal protein [Planctomycetota bacterium]
MPSIVSGNGSAHRQVSCTHCGGPCDVGARAMSIFCPHCRKRLILENYKIDTYYAVRDFSTCGDIVVEKTGHVVAPIKAQNLTVKGKVQGQVTARGEVNISKNGSLKGEIEAASIVVEPGATLDAFLRIGPTSETQ